MGAPEPPKHQTIFSGYIIAAVMLLFVCGADRAHAFQTWEDGNKLLEWCDQQPFTLFAYVAGIDDAITQEGASFPYCLPPSIIGRQLIDQVCGYLRRNPATRHYIAPVLVRDALAEGWPCP